MTSTREAREFAQRCADATRGRMPEYRAWDVIAERGHEWEVARYPDGRPYRGGPLMTPRMCFTNAARTVLGVTAFDPEGCAYAEGFALSPLGLWVHHAWVVNAYGLVIERTWREPGSRYVGVTFDDWPRGPGLCQLSGHSLEMAWGPSLASNPAGADLLFSTTN
jgi:hypothetical protein